MRTAVIHNLSVEDAAQLRALRKGMPMSAPLADREILRAGLRALSDPCPDCVACEVEIESLREELAMAKKPKRCSKKKKPTLEATPPETPED